MSFTCCLGFGAKAGYGIDPAGAVQRSRKPAPGPQADRGSGYPIGEGENPFHAVMVIPHGLCSLTTNGDGIPAIKALLRAKRLDKIVAVDAVKHMVTLEASVRSKFEVTHEDAGSREHKRDHEHGHEHHHPHLH
jgi:hypothetical protein